MALAASPVLAARPCHLRGSGGCETLATAARMVVPSVRPVIPPASNFRPLVDPVHDQAAMLISSVDHTPPIDAIGRVGVVGHAGIVEAISRSQQNTTEADPGVGWMRFPDPPPDQPSRVWCAEQRSSAPSHLRPTSTFADAVEIVHRSIQHRLWEHDHAAELRVEVLPVGLGIPCYSSCWRAALRTFGVPCRIQSRHPPLAQRILISGQVRHPRRARRSGSRGRHRTCRRVLGRARARA